TFTLVNGSFFIPLFTSITVYRLFFHPLSSFPGPVLARLSMWWRVWQVAHMNSYEVIHRLHEEYGPIVRIGPNHLSINDVNAFYIIYGNQTKAAKPTTMYGMREERSLNTELDVRRHGARRVPFEKALSPKRIVEYLPALYRLTDLLVTRLSEEKDHVLLNRWLSYFAFDIMGELAYSKSYKCLETRTMHEGIEALEQFLAAASWIGYVPWVAQIMSRLPIPDPTQSLQDFARSALEERKKESNPSADVLSFVFSGKQDLTPGEQMQDAMLLQVAGSDTTLSALIFACYHLAIDKQLQRDIREEIQGNLEAELTFDTVKDLALLQGLINETLRLHPPGATALPREIPKGGVHVCNTFIPEYTTASCPTWSIQRDPKHYDNADTFDVKRWAAPSNKAFIPFSMGPSNCVGKLFAYMEMKYVLAKLIISFDISLAEGEDGAALKKSKDHVAVACGEL
ncbi:hypothetical protein ASPZODRAFT_32476, partial [Penicilliopsis zonata CBS 506.65]